ncbi:MAG: hypothetical protein LBL34_06525 [Clostridiales bacterium]|nr:hypothetical protein [Clostridiales bacterium]
MNKEYNFKSVEDLLEHINRGCEVGFLYKGKEYFMGMPTKKVDYKFFIGECCNDNSDGEYMTAEEMLEYSFGDRKLKDIVNDMEVIERSF